MRQVLSKSMMFLIAGCLFSVILLTGNQYIVPAAEIVEMEEWYIPDYEPGIKGGVQIQSDSHSLKEGDIIEVEILYDRNKFEYPACCFAVTSYYDKNVLECVEGSIKDEHRTEYGASIVEKFQKCVEFIEKNKLYDTGIPLEYGDTMVMLSTCEGSTRDSRLVVVGVKISPDEKEHYLYSRDIK